LFQTKLSLLYYSSLLSNSPNLHKKYHLFANTIKAASQFHVHDIALAFQSMSSSITAEAKASGTEFPFVTVPTFETLGEAARRLSGIEVLAFTPIVTLAQVPFWLSYAFGEQGWIETSREVAISSGEGTVQATDYLPGNITPIIYDVGPEGVGPSQGQGPFLPFWQTSPPPFSPGLINYNVLDRPWMNPLFDSVKIIREAILSGVEDFSGLSETAFKPEDHEAYHSSLVDWVKDGSSSTYDHPHSLIMQPVFKTLNDDSSEIVGFVNGVVPWDRYLIDLLPEGVKGITCVLKNSCEQSFTYALNANEVSVLHALDDRKCALIS
jgi:hypothetical protein